MSKVVAVCVHRMWRAEGGMTVTRYEGLVLIVNWSKGTVLLIHASKNFVFVMDGFKVMAFVLAGISFQSDLPTHCRCRVLLFHPTVLNDAHTLGMNPLDERSAPRRGLYLYNSQHSQDTDTHAPTGIRTRSPSKRTVAGPRRTPRGHRDR